MTDELKGNVGTTVDPESFFTDDTSAPADQQPQTAPPTSEPTPETWDGTPWKFKAAGKEWTPKDKAELLKWASFGVNYDQKARALNQQKAELLKMKQEMAQAKAAPPPAEPTSLFPPDPELAALKEKIAELEKGVNTNLTYAEKQETARFEEALDSGREALAKEGIDLSDNDWQELLLEIMDAADDLPETAIDTPDKVMKLLRRTYYELHPDALDSVAEKRAQARFDDLKKSLGAKTVVEGAASGSPKKVDKPSSFLDAQEKAEAFFNDI